MVAHAAHRVEPAHSTLRKQPDHAERDLGSADVVRYVFDPEPADVVRQVAEIRVSGIFSRSPRLSKLLEFLAIEAVEGRGSMLKEIVIGKRLYSEDGSFDPRIASSVRVEMSRLRRKLQEYNDGPGRDAAFQLVLPRRRYCPIFLSSRPDVRRLYGAQKRLVDCDVGLLVMPFRRIGVCNMFDALGDEMTDEIIRQIGEASSVTVLSRMITLQFRHQILPLRDVVKMTGAGLFLFGTLRVVRDKLRVTSELLNDRGIALWSNRVDAKIIVGSRVRADDLVRDIFKAIPLNLLNQETNP